MKRLSIAAILFVLSCFICSASLLPSQALNQAEQFIALIDNQEYKTAFNNSSLLLQTLTSRQEWIAERGRSVELLGSVQDSKLVAIKARSSYPGLPDGDYLIVYYEARTERKEKAAEVLLLSKNANLWSVCSYRLK
jgi:hypothetical protein